ncbi:OLC1v1003045C1 [Oldenlandia corymbosa var. corymbosa]|uniref:OLC1v1003045C1 n=1 Tax=Oldenlandia corymbosa var. corymbosa TaxID=529605 RepID=A0AAV1DAE4_OLDCO|nr:OLC1v1003045C1 [Oldenlandia corymbosa var. corymbosa]
MTDNKYNVEAAELVANEALRLPISAAAPIYEQLLVTYPTAAKFWKQFVEAHMAVNNDDQIRQIFSRCLLNCLYVPLWQCYIRFIRKVNDKKGMEGHEEIRKAFDFMLNYVGSDIAAGPLWMEYITFLKSWPAHTAIEETQRMTAVRKAYQKAIVTPTSHIEQIWRDYENFENSVSRALAKGLVSEYQPKYNSARAVYKERKKYADEIDWNMLAVPPSGTSKEEAQWMAWKKLLNFERGNPQRIDNDLAVKHMAFTYEQCLMYLYHYPDIWYDYATWHAKNGSTNAAIKVFQRALKALPDSEMLKYAYAELEESCGHIEPAKKVYESLLGDDGNVPALSHIQFLRFLRRTEGAEAARKYFVDARKSPSCTYHVYVAYAMMAFCLDKDAKLAHTVFEAGMKRFMHEPSYILEYADFLARVNDDRNIRALFERALNLLPPEESVEIWNRFIEFEQTYGDLSSMLKVEQRRKEALTRADDDGESALENSLQDIVSRYSFRDLWPCSSKDLDHLQQQEYLRKNITKKSEKVAPSDAVASAGKNSTEVPAGASSVKSVVRPDISRMNLYAPREKIGLNTPGQPAVPVILPSAVTTGSGTPNVVDIMKTLPPALASFIANLPAVEGPPLDVDFVLSVCLESNVPPIPGRSVNPSQIQAGPVPNTSNTGGPGKFKPTRDRNAGKRKEADRQEDEAAIVQSQALPRDIFKIRQMRKARGGTGTNSQTGTGSASYGSASAFSGELSGSTG